MKEKMWGGEPETAEQEEVYTITPNGCPICLSGGKLKEVEGESVRRPSGRLLLKWACQQCYHDFWI